jgi:cytochrome c oxidase subunit 2
MHRLFSYIFPDQASNLAPSVDAIYFVLLGLSTFIILLVFVPAFRAKQDVVPGRYTTEWFTPTKPGRYHLFARNTAAPTIRQWTDGSLMEPAEHAEWLNKGAVSESLGAEGERDFHTLGCSGCHARNSQIRAPLLEGIYGKPVPLSDGTLVIADDQYLRDSILLPNKQIVAGYEALMPTFQGQIDEEKVNAIVAYLKSLSDSERSQQ